MTGHEAKTYDRAASSRLELTLRSLQSGRATDWRHHLAGSVIVMIPIAIIFIACQRYFVRGIALTGPI